MLVSKFPISSFGLLGWRYVFAFIIGGLLGLILIFSTYVGLITKRIGHSELPATYKWFLLENVPGPRLIIESGSNSHHGLDTDRISKALNITAINIADNAGYDLEQKAARLEAHARPGDVVILPLEWSYYTRNRATDDFVAGLWHSNSNYFNSVGFIDRVRLALSLPPAEVFKFYFNANAEASEETEQIRALYVSALMHSSGHSAFEAPRELAAGVEEQSCDEYIFGDEVPTISAKFKRALKRFKALDEAGIKVVFAWPVMVGDDCFSNGPTLNAFADNIQNLVESYELSFIGRPSQGVYSTELRDNTPYHLVRTGTAIHTDKMIKWLRQLGIKPAGESQDLRKYATTLLNEFELKNAKSRAINALRLGEQVMISDQGSTNLVDFSAGWWGREPYGRWMRDNEATLRVHLPKTLPQDARLVLRGLPLNQEPVSIRIIVNGVLASSGSTGFTNEISVPLSSAVSGEIAHIVIRVRDNAPAYSPYDLGIGSDQRTLTFNLQSIKLISGAQDTSRMEADVLDKRVLRSAKPMATSPNPAAEPADRSIDLVAFDVNERVTLGSSQASKKISFGENWWLQEANGRWMKCCEASFKIRLPAGLPESANLEFTGDTFQGLRRIMTVKLNDKPVLDDVLTREKGLRIPLGEAVHNETIQIDLSFDDQDFQSPSVLNISDDNRIMSIFLEAISLHASGSE